MQWENQAQQRTEIRLFCFLLPLKHVKFLFSFQSHRQALIQSLWWACSTFSWSFSVFVEHVSDCFSERFKFPKIDQEVYRWICQCQRNNNISRYEEQTISGGRNEGSNSWGWKGQDKYKETNSHSHETHCEIIHLFSLLFLLVVRWGIPLSPLNENYQQTCCSNCHNYRQNNSEKCWDAKIDFIEFFPLCKSGFSSDIMGNFPTLNHTDLQRSKANLLLSLCLYLRFRINVAVEKNDVAGDKLTSFSSQ